MKKSGLHVPARLRAQTTTTSCPTNSSVHHAAQSSMAVANTENLSLGVHTLEDFGLQNYCIPEPIPNKVLLRMDSCQNL